MSRKIVKFVQVVQETDRSTTNCDCETLLCRLCALCTHVEAYVIHEPHKEN